MEIQHQNNSSTYSPMSEIAKRITLEALNQVTDTELPHRLIARSPDIIQPDAPIQFTAYNDQIITVTADEPVVPNTWYELFLSVTGKPNEFTALLLCPLPLGTNGLQTKNVTQLLTLIEQDPGFFSADQPFPL